MGQAVGVAAIVMAGLVLITVLWQVLRIGKAKALQEGKGNGAWRNEVREIRARLEALEARLGGQGARIPGGG